MHPAINIKQQHPAAAPPPAAPAFKLQNALWQLQPAAPPCSGTSTSAQTEAGEPCSGSTTRVDPGPKQKLRFTETRFGGTTRACLPTHGTSLGIIGARPLLQENAKHNVTMWMWIHAADHARTCKVRKAEKSNTNPPNVLTSGVRKKQSLTANATHLSQHCLRGQGTNNPGC